MGSITAPSFPQAPKPTNNTRGLLLVLMTPARFKDPDSWLLPGFTPPESNGSLVWSGKIAGVALTIHAAVLGKALREGGWDMVNRSPRAVQSLISAGSAYYVTVEGDINVAINSLHGIRIGEDQSQAWSRCRRSVERPRVLNSKEPS
ncbi:MAG: hypothetical protein IPH09_14405 [bacterium]|nr:hypothetical protein [bacterium]